MFIIRFWNVPLPKIWNLAGEILVEFMVRSCTAVLVWYLSVFFPLHARRCGANLRWTLDRCNLACVLWLLIVERIAGLAPICTIELRAFHVRGAVRMMQPFGKRCCN